MAVDILLKLDSIDGESMIDSHENEIDILSWTWGHSQSGTTHMGKGGGAGKVHVHDIGITKYLDKASVNLIKACCKGTHIAKGKITVRKAGDSPLDFFTVELDEIIVTSVSDGGSHSDDRPVENITLNFREFQLKYQPQSNTGTSDGAITFGWDVAKNAAA